MAQKKKSSGAQRAVNDTKKKAGASSGSGKGTAAGKNTPTAIPGESRIPVRVVFALVSLGLFIFFLIMGINPEGALPEVFHAVINGLIGKVGFYFSIPALLYLFLIIISSKGKPIKMRSICLISFVLICGCVYHLTVNNQTFVGGFKIVKDLYVGGITGASGGLICGSIAMLVRWACGPWLPYLIFMVAGILTLLASMNITVPSIIRAIQNRPREDWEGEAYYEERPEPAERVVNHIANKRIEHNRQKRQRQIAEMEEVVLPMEEIEEQASAVITEQKRPVAKTNKAADLMNQIADIDDPVTASSESTETVSEDLTIAFPEPKRVDIPVTIEAPAVQEEPIPSNMPVFRPNAPLAEGPKVEKEVVSAPNGKVTSKEAAESAQQVAEEIARNQAVVKPVYCFPPIDLLNKPSRNSADGTVEMKENSRRLNETLASFKIDAHIVNVTRGPSVTRYEVELDKGVRLNKLTTVADDIALSLGAVSVRIAPVPGKISVVGIEVPNRAVTMVPLREVLDSSEFERSKSKSTFAVGKDIGGACIVGNIAKMPHMLIAGTTGSGKSVCMNSIILSLLYKSSPEDVKLIMVDPKMVELANYNGIPHLMIPVVTDPKKAAGSLQWAVTEMMRRYKTMSDAGVRDLESYNSIAMADDGEKLPQLVVIIDELADLMLVAAKEVEDSICRIAQMGRAAGIHLVIATQRPSADVITGLMKANIPSRIAFSVASAMESRIILDTVGAEKLVGKGDMLFAPIGCGKPLRVQGCFVTDAEVEAVTNYVKENYLAEYDQQVLEEIEKKAVQTGKKAATAADPEPSADELDGDEMLPAAVDVILETGQASVSMLQRRLKLGYARAARIVDEMEEKGIVGPFQGSKPRTILVTKEQWAAMKAGGTQMGFEDLPFDEGVPEELL